MMKALPSSKQYGARGGFTLVEALVVAAVIGILASLLLPALSSAKGRGYTVVCLNNQRQLALAWHLYAEDREGYLAYNYGVPDTEATIASGAFLNWANNVMSWGDVKPGNTNDANLSRGGLGPYLAGVASPFRCPSDRALSAVQRAAGWRERVRSYSMNAMMGYAGGYIKYGTNINNPNHKQFIRMGDIPNPSGIFVFIDEHPHSINDGYFLNKPDSNPPHWYDLPAAHHNRGANLSFADMHIEYRKWVSVNTVHPVVEEPVKLPMKVALEDVDDRRDYDWLMQRTTIVR
jgi:prepilin-type N-terminal cleavage/methylation domain-containing protein